MRILIATDAWRPQTNGVVRTLETTIGQLERLGHEVKTVTPADFRTVPCPTYPEIRLSLFPGVGVTQKIKAFRPDSVHIATEGPIGLATRNYCVRNKLAFTTSYHTAFPEYVAARAPVPLSWGYSFMRWFHGASSAVMVATDTVANHLSEQRFRNIRRWSRGVDLKTFTPDLEPALNNLPKPVFLYVGRVAVEKNLRDFLDLDLPGSKLVVGDGPDLAQLRKDYPQAVFAGAKYGEDLARHYISGDVFVFPSRTDTFGLVLIEAMACGVPVAAYPVQGPVDVIGPSGPGKLSDDLKQAALDALNIPRDQAAQFAHGFSWEKCTDQFLENLVRCDAKRA